MSSSAAIGGQGLSRDRGGLHPQRLDDSLGDEPLPRGPRLFGHGPAESAIHDVVVRELRPKRRSLLKEAHTRQDFAGAEIAFDKQEVAAHQSRAMAEQVADRDMF